MGIAKCWTLFNEKFSWEDELNSLNSNRTQKFWVKTFRISKLETSEVLANDEPNDDPFNTSTESVFSNEDQLSTSSS